MSGDSRRSSVWRATADVTAFPPLDSDRVAEVVVVGGGITGLTTALLLAEADVQVTVLEARQLAAGATGGTTGKITSQHGMIYHDLIERHGEDTARTYAVVNEAAIGAIAAICDRLEIDADWQPTDAYVFAQHTDEIDPLRREEAAASHLGLPAEWTNTAELPFAVHGAVRFTGQAQFHPVAYIDGLARALDDHPNVTIHGATRATSVREDRDRVVVTTPHGQVTADHVVLGTLLPVTDRGFEFARTRASRSYGIAAVVPEDELPESMYISAGDPSRSLRHYRGDGTAYLIVVGESHDVGQGGETREHDQTLEAFAREHFTVHDVPFRWSAQDYVPDDRLPFIGTTNFSERIYVATGFQKWGLTNGTAAARIITDAILGRDNPHAEAFGPARRTVTESARRFLQHNLDVAKRFVADRVSPDAETIDDIAPGTGGTVRVEGELLAVSKDDAGRVTSRSAVCTHLGCIVQWNPAERSWDCPCHGSRFALDGDVLEGPATRSLHEA